MTVASIVEEEEKAAPAPVLARHYTVFWTAVVFEEGRYHLARGNTQCTVHADLYGPRLNEELLVGLYRQEPTAKNLAITCKVDHGLVDPSLVPPEEPLHQFVVVVRVIDGDRLQDIKAVWVTGKGIGFPCSSEFYEAVEAAAGGEALVFGVGHVCECLIPPPPPPARFMGHV